jgi:hypothetical protein
MCFMPASLVSGSIQGLLHAQLAILMWLEDTEVAEGTGLWIHGPSGFGKTTVMKVLHCRYGKQIFILNKRAAIQGYDDTSLMGYHDEPVLIMDDAKRPQKADAWPDQFIDCIKALTNGYAISFIYGHGKYSYTPAAKVVITSTQAPPADVEGEVKRRYQTMRVFPNGEWKITEKTKPGTGEGKFIVPAPGMATAREEYERRLALADVAAGDSADGEPPDDPASGAPAAATAPAEPPAAPEPPGSPLPEFQPTPDADADASDGESEWRNKVQDSILALPLLDLDLEPPFTYTPMVNSVLYSQDYFQFVNVVERRWGYRRWIQHIAELVMAREDAELSLETLGMETAHSVACLDDNINNAEDVEHLAYCVRLAKHCPLRPHGEDSPPDDEWRPVRNSVGVQTGMASVREEAGAAAALRPKTEEPRHAERPGGQKDEDPSPEGTFSTTLSWGGAASEAGRAAMRSRQKLPQQSNLSRKIPLMESRQVPLALPRLPGCRGSK